MQKRVLSNQFKSVIDKSKTDYDIIIACNAPKIEVETAKIIFCKGGEYPAEIIVRKDAEKTLILYGSWKNLRGLVSSKQNDFKYVIPSGDKIDWDKQIEIVKKQMIDCKETKKTEDVSKMIETVKNALNVVEEIKNKKNIKEK